MVIPVHKRTEVGEHTIVVIAVGEPQKLARATINVHLYCKLGVLVIRVARPTPETDRPVGGVYYGRVVRHRRLIVSHEPHRARVMEQGPPNSARRIGLRLHPRVAGNARIEVERPLESVHRP